MSRDEASVLDMLQFATRARRHLRGVSKREFEADELLQDAAIRCLLVIGEATNSVSAAYRNAHPEVPWAEMCGMRNRLVHDYRGTDLGIVWTVASERLPELIRTLEPLVPSSDYEGIPDEWEFL